MPMSIPAASGWALEQLTAYLFGLASAGDPEAVVLEALDRAAEAMEAEVAALIVDGNVVSSIGFANGQGAGRRLAAYGRRPSYASRPAGGRTLPRLWRIV